MVSVFLKPLWHRGEQCIGIYFEKNFAVADLVKRAVRVTFSNTHKCWYAAFSEKNYQKILGVLEGKVELDYAELQSWIRLHKDEKVPEGSKNTKPSVIPAISTGYSVITKDNARPGIHPVNAHILPKMLERLKLKAYSRSTIKTYINEMSQLLQAVKDLPADDLKPENLKKYLVYCYEKLNLSENTLHSRINAMKFYYEQVLGREKFFWEIPRPKKPLLLPKILNEVELSRLFNALTNKKHKAMLFTAYSAGLRVSEIVNLKIADIDSQRMQIFISRAKGKKDRYVNLSPVLLDILRKYIQYQPRPVEYLFESEQTGTAYPVRTVQQIFQNAKHKAGIRKEVGIHSLRHSFATHLLDKGTDIKYIKEILGHFNIKTTERYLHVSKKQLVNIASPLDDLMKNNSIEW